MIDVAWAVRIKRKREKLIYPYPFVRGGRKDCAFEANIMDLSLLIDAVEG